MNRTPYGDQPSKGRLVRSATDSVYQRVQPVAQGQQPCQIDTCCAEVLPQDILCAAHAELRAQGLVEAVNRLSDQPPEPKHARAMRADPWLPFGQDGSE